MEQDKVVNRVLRDMKLMGVISEDTNGEIRPYLNALFVAGWEVGWLDAHQTTAKAIGQYDLNGKLICSYKSLKEACKKTGFSKNGILHSMKFEVPTRQKWFWRYLVLGKPDLNS
jgi:hypothetical protein